MTALAIPATPAQLAAAGNPLYDALFIEHTIATLTADYWQQSTPCPRCGAAGSDPCRQPSGRTTARHEGRP